ncbi:hypothetical protein L1987_11382 [Smallanthus sonchifolius]|uniref:Uncharacterized protein n=1 Tax=Smallanthus sonchifolius TaxID=185202 RepID=A0ACB9JE92_9ASTR|nr:hypothetical protein L1987_11382 [Smallanthus sonchifolius]
MMHWQNILKSVIFAQSHPLRSHVHDKTLRKGQMGIKVWIGNAYWRIGGTGSLIGNGLLNTYKKVVVKSIWLYWQEGLMIIYVPRLDMEWRFVRKKSKELKVIDGSLIDYYEFNFYKRQSQMKLSQRGIGIYKEVKLDCTFGIKTTMWVFEESTMKLNNAIQMQNHKSQRRWRIKCYGDTQSNVKVKLLKRFQCLITGLDIIGQVFKNQCPIRQSQICHSQQRIDYAMSMSQSQHYYWVLLNPNLSWKITIEYFTKYIQMAKYTHLKLELYWSWACLNAIWARSYLCPRIRLARLVQLFINAEDATKIMGNEQFKRRDYKSDLNTFRLLKFDPKLIVGPSLKFDLPFVNQVFSDLPKTANKFVFILVIPSFEARYGRMPPDIARSLHDSPSTAATWEDISSLL